MADTKAAFEVDYRHHNGLFSPCGGADQECRHHLESLQNVVRPLFSVNNMARLNERKNLPSIGSRRRWSSAMPVLMVRVEGGSYPFVGTLTTALKLLSPANCSEMPPLLTESTTAFSKRRSVLTLKGVLNANCTIRLPSVDYGAYEVLTLPVRPCSFAKWAFNPDPFLFPENHFLQMVHQPVP